MNGHVRRRNVVVVHKCAGEHFSYDSRNTDEPRVVEFADSLGLVNVQYTFYETGFSVVEEWVLVDVTSMWAEACADDAWHLIVASGMKRGSRPGDRRWYRRWRSRITEIITLLPSVLWQWCCQLHGFHQLVGQSFHFCLSRDNCFIWCWWIQSLCVSMTSWLGEEAFDLVSAVSLGFHSLIIININNVLI